MNSQLLASIAPYQTQIWSLLVVVFGATVNRVMRLRPKLQYSVRHASNILVDEPLLDADGKQIRPRQIVRTASIVVENSGLQAARNVEVAFNWKPPILNVLPARAYTETSSPFDRYSIKFDSFAPGEQVTIDIMSINADLPIMTAVRSDDVQGQSISMEPQRVYPPVVRNTFAGLLMLGAASAVYLLITGIQFVAA